MLIQVKELINQSNNTCLIRLFVVDQRKFTDFLKIHALHWFDQINWKIYLEFSELDQGAGS